MITCAKPRKLWWCDVSNGTRGGNNSSKWLDWTSLDELRMTLAAMNTYEDSACIFKNKNYDTLISIKQCLGIVLVRLQLSL